MTFHHAPSDAIRAENFSRGKWRCGGVFSRLLMLLVVVLAMGGSVRSVCADLIKGEILSVGIGGVNGKGGMYRAGAWVPVQVRIENRSGAVLEGRLGVEQLDLDGDKVMSVGADVILQPGDVEGRDYWVYYWPRPDDELRGPKSVVFLDKSGTQVRATIPVSTGGDTIGLGLRDENDNRSMRWMVILGPSTAGLGSFANAFGGTEAVRSCVASDANHLPDNVLGLDGVDTILWEADKIRPSDIPPDFQLKAILEWVRAGGHLIISVGTQGQEFSKGGDALAAAIPMTFTAPREVKLSDLATFPGLTDLKGVETLPQLTGTLHDGARIISPGATGLQDHPLAVTGLYGRGAITLLTVDITNPVFINKIDPHNWLTFWNEVGGWRGTEMLTQAEYKQKESVRREGDNPTVSTQTHELRLGDRFSDLVDVTEVTQTRLLVAVLFLAVYWLVAGPIGHMVLKYYKVVHWSWWIFGATVLVAGGAASAVVFFLQITNYNLRHVSFMLGSVNSKEVSVVGYYGVFAPRSGQIHVTQPDATGMNYLAPFNLPTGEPVKPFADPDNYTLFDDKPSDASPVFRNTLKKMQGRWTGTHEGIEGTAAFRIDPPGKPLKGADRFVKPLTGTLTNNSGYDLQNVEIIVDGSSATQFWMAPYYLYRLPNWKAGATIDLQKDDVLTLEPSGVSKYPESLNDLLQLLSHQFHEDRGFGVKYGEKEEISEVNQETAKGHSIDILYLLLDAAEPDALSAADRVVAVRSLTRTTDCTKMLRAAGGLIIARAGNIADKNYVKSPVPLTVNDRSVAGQGEVIFAWALPLAGQFPGTQLLDKNEPPKPEAAP